MTLEKGVIVRQQKVALLENTSRWMNVIGIATSANSGWCCIPRTERISFHTDGTVWRR